jgi:hypothetical protein
VEDLHFKVPWDESESRKSVSSSVKLAIIWINKCLEFSILLVNSKKLRTSQKVLKYTKNNEKCTTLKGLV